jgi:hypothetical protein
MGPLFAAILALLFFAFAAFSGCLAILFSALAARHLFAGPSRFFGVYVLGSGILGAVVSALFGMSMRWNVIGDVIMKKAILGYSAWVLIGFGWAAAAAFFIGSIIRRLLFQEPKK